VNAQIELDLNELPVETCVAAIVAAVRSELERTEPAEGGPG
jgi:hypothetical protein